jgi:excisionase family DNA binding protein
MMLTVKELSGWLKIKPSTLYLWATEGKIPCRRIHSLVRFEQEAIKRWLESFPELHPQPPPKLTKSSVPVDLKTLIAAAKRESYTPPHGETKPISSLIRKENVDGAI